MRSIGITGHQGLDRATSALIVEELRAELEARGPVCGITSLAEGADQLFADEVLKGGGSLFAVIPSAGYEQSFGDPSALRCFRVLKGRASKVLELDFGEPGEEAYWAAGQKVVELSDEMLAVWDGQPSGGLGGTADVVAFAHQKNVPVSVIWPSGSSRA